MPHVPHTRDRLMQAAIDLLWERSYFSTGVDELCKRAGARKGSFYHFFPSKIDLAIDAIRGRWAAVKTQVFESIARSGTPGLDRLRRLTDVLAEQQNQSVHRFHVVLGSPFGHLGQELAHQDQRLRGAIQDIFDEQVHYLERWLDEAATSGEILLGDNRQRARNVLALLEGAMLMAKIADSVDVFTRIAGSVPVVASAI